MLLCTACDSFLRDLSQRTRVASVSKLMNELRVPQVKISAEPGQTLLMRNSSGAEPGQSLLMRNSNWVKRENTRKKIRRAMRQRR